MKSDDQHDQPDKPHPLVTEIEAAMGKPDDPVFVDKKRRGVDRRHFPAMKSSKPEQQGLPFGGRRKKS